MCQLALIRITQGASYDLSPLADLINSHRLVVIAQYAFQPGGRHDHEFLFLFSFLVDLLVSYNKRERILLRSR
jgi:hypothetical protein